MAMPASTVWQVLATAGFAGGTVYWLIAGGNAGSGFAPADEES